MGSEIDGDAEFERIRPAVEPNALPPDLPVAPAPVPF